MDFNSVLEVLWTIVSANYNFEVGPILVQIHWTAPLLAIACIGWAAVTLKKAGNASVTGSLFGGLMILLSLLVHEAAHASAIVYFGYDLLSFGIHGFGAGVLSKTLPAQMNPEAEIATALIGPIANFVIGAAVVMVWRGPTAKAVAIPNLWMGRINILPIFILDGARACEGLFRLGGIDTNHASGMVFVVSVVMIGVYKWLWQPLKSLEERVLKM